MKRTPVVILMILIVAFIFSFAIGQINVVYGQNEVRCGEIIRGEFGIEEEEHIFLLAMAPGESFEIYLEPIGDHLKSLIAWYDPAGRERDNSDLKKSPQIESGILSARGNYTILVANANLYGAGTLSNHTVLNFSGAGVYTLYIGCTKGDQKIEPGDIPIPTSTPLPLPTATIRSALPQKVSESFSGVGFPGLAPVDFSEVAIVPLAMNSAMVGVVPLGNEILGFSFEAKAEDVFDLNYRQLSGNLNLGLVVLSQSNQVYFQASLVTSETISTQFVLPEPGQFTIEIFRISLVNPIDPKPTSFQIQGILNPENVEQ